MLGLFGCDDPVPDDVENLYPQKQILWPSIADTPWPMLRHDPQGTNRSQYSGGQLGEVVFGYFVEGFQSEASLSLDTDNNVFRLFTNSGYGSQFNVNPDGETMWFTQIGRLMEAVSTLLHTPNNIGLVPLYKEKTIVSMDLQTGIANQTIYLGYEPLHLKIDRSGNMYVHSSDRTTFNSYTPAGEMRWSITDLGWMSGEFQFSPDGEVIYVMGADSLYALSTDGEKIWSYKKIGGTYTFLLDNSGCLYLGEGNSTITCLLPTGGVRWAVAAEEIDMERFFSGNSQTMDTKGNFYFNGSMIDGPSGIFSLDNEGNFRWFREHRLTTDLICDQDDNIYFGYSEGPYKMTSIDSDGNLNWQVEYGNGHGRMAFTPAIGSNGYVYYPIKDGYDYDIIVVR